MFGVKILQHCGVTRNMFYSRQKIVFHSHEQTAFLPRILEIQRLEVVSKTTFSVANDSNQAEVLKLLIFSETEETKLALTPTYLIKGF